MQNPTSANKGPESHNEPPSPLANWPSGASRWTRLECSAQKALSGPGPTVGPEAAPYPLWASCFPLLHLRPWNKSCGLWRGGGGEMGQRTGRRGGCVEQKRVLVTVGQPSPAPAPAPTCSAIQSRAAATLDRGLKPTPGLHQSPSKGRAAGLSGRGTWGVRWGGACAPPPTPALLASHLVSK